MQTALVVVRPFGRYAVGDVITDVEDASEVAAGEHADNVVRVPHPFSGAGGGAGAAGAAGAGGGRAPGAGSSGGAGADAKKEG